ncbi:hypothetical protein FIE12Z_9467 [Fusarium flagelliforme]|uniref:BTB domain-containing protein n=1 Tax=Fusarium flagelliforme TaxID=2675880 RepID=A0A395MEN1_9HYPO|nr:hypothetical protein FIE12Z_9467 [Fusarium flagelliforme]
MAISAVNEVHPDGDTLFILRHSDAPFATGEFEEPWPNALPAYQTEASKRYEASVLPKSHETVDEHSSLVQASPQSSHLRFRLSSALLINTSSYFKKSLSEQWNAQDPESGYKWTLVGKNWDGEAFLLLMNILHNKARAVPLKIELEMFAKVAVLVDYYGCHEVVELWADKWSSLGATLVNSYYSRDLLFKLTISWVFRQRETFRGATKVAIRASRGPIHTLDLPIPKLVVGKLSKILSLVQGSDRSKQTP